MSSSSVWFQLYYKGKDEPMGSPVEIEPIPKNVGALAKAVKKERSVALSHCDAADLVVYPPKSSGDENKRCEPGKKLEEAIDELKKNVTPPTSDHHPLIVVAPDPNKELSGDPGYPFNDSIYILHSKPDENEIAVIATAFAATKTVALTTGHTISSKNNESGETLLINEPLFLTTVLVHNNGVISPEESKVEIPVAVKNFHCENDWAVLERSDGGVFCRTTPVATSLTDIPRDGASKPMTFYHVPVVLFRYDTEYTDRLRRP